MTLTDILEKSAKNFADKTAFTMRMGYRTASLSYKEVYELSSKIARLLEKNGLKKGDKVLLLAPNSPYWICVFWGCLLRGYIPVPLNVQSTAELVQKIAAQTEAKIIFKHVNFKEELPAYLKDYNIEFIQELVAGEDISNFEKSTLSENDIAELMYTSGTTGDPKGVILTHKNIYSNLTTLTQLIPLSRKDIFLSVLPLSHIFEQIIGFLMPFYHGAHIVYAHSPAAIPELLKEYRITKMAAVPEFLGVMMARIETKTRGIPLWLASYFIRRKFGGRFRVVASGGAPLDPELERKWFALGIDLVQGYGLTETSPVISTNTYKSHRIGSVGKALPGVEIKIASDGEVLVKGPNVFRGYFKNDQKTKEAFTADDWFQTGDMGELDKDGFLYIRGRKKYLILGPGGQNIYPEDIEFELNKIAGIKDSCVVGLEKPGGQIEIHASLLLTESIVPKEKEIEEMIKKANNRLAPYQYIIDWSIWPKEDFPRSATKKIKKEEVIKWLKGFKTTAKVAASDSKTLLERILIEITGYEVVGKLNLDSLLRIELVSRIEEKFGVTIDESKIGPETTVSDLKEMIHQARRQPIKKPSTFKYWPRSWGASLVRRLGQSLLIFPLARIFIKLKTEGKKYLENLSLPVIFMPNHLSYLDSLVVIMALPPKIRNRVAFAAAQDVLYEKYKYFSRLAELYFNAFPFPRHKSGLEYAGRLLDKNWSIVVYPEGQMSETGKLRQFKRGAGLMAVEMDTQVVPVKISGTAEIVPYRKFLPRKRGLVIVKFGKPLKFKHDDSYIQATKKLQEISQKL